jgi:hypothetical protein
VISSCLASGPDSKQSEDEQGLHITVSRIHTVQFIKTPPLPENSDLKQGPYVWGPDWPITVKITHVQPAEQPPDER